MNQVSWKRILERAADEAHGENSADVINFQDHVPNHTKNQRRSERSVSEATGLETALRQTLDRNGRRGPDYGVQGMPLRQDRIFTSDNAASSADHEAYNQLVNRQPRREIATVSRAPRQAEKGGSGARNLLAVSLSAAVIGFAYYQISGEWSQRQNGQPVAQQEPEIQQPVVSSGSTGSATHNNAISIQNRPVRSANFEGNRLDLRPSVPKETAERRLEPPAAKLAVISKDIEQKGKPLFDTATETSAPAAATPAVFKAPVSLSGAEQTMLERGRELVRLGDFAGARLVFEHLAAQDVALGAFSLAQTYDPQFFDKVNVYGGVAPNEKLAAKWYERAAQLSR